MCATSLAFMSRRCCCLKRAARGLASPHVRLPVCSRLTAGTFNIQVLIDHVHKHPQLIKEFPKTVEGQPGAPVPPTNWFDCSRSLRTLDITPTPESSTAVDMTKSLAERKAGWAEAKAAEA